MASLTMLSSKQRLIFVNVCTSLSQLVRKRGTQRDRETTNGASRFEILGYAPPAEGRTADSGEGKSMFDFIILKSRKAISFDAYVAFAFYAHKILCSQNRNSVFVKQ